MLYTVCVSYPQCNGEGFESIALKLEMHRRADRHTQNHLFIYRLGIYFFIYILILGFYIPKDRDNGQKHKKN